MRFCDYPAYDSREEVVRYFSAVREIDFLEIFGIVRHFQDSVGSDIPDGFHFPAAHILAALSGEDVETFVCDVEAITDVDDRGSFSNEGTDVID
jgi:hypothetical protein